MLYTCSHESYIWNANNISRIQNLSLSKGILSSMRKPDKIDIESGYYCFAAAGYCVANKNYYNFRPYSWYDNIYIAPAK